MIEDDPYDNPTPLSGADIGENCMHLRPDGTFGITNDPPEERSNTWKDARRIMGCSDEAISELGVRPSGIADYVVMGVGVSCGHGNSKRYLCRGHRKNDCPHIRRLVRFKEERLEVLNSVMADPALEVPIIG